MMEVAPDVGIPTTMRAARLRQYNKPYLLEVADVPSIKPNELLVRIHAAGYCHSDLQVAQGQFGSKLPMIPSHEPAGCVVKIGSSCREDWKLGDRVGILNYKNACSSCAGCGLSKREYGNFDPRFCEHRETAGFHHDGAFAEYLAADPVTTVKLPESVEFTQAAPLMCAGATVWGALEKGTQGLGKGCPVLIVGIGGLGHLGVQFAKAMGFRTIAADSREEGRILAGQVSNDELKPDLVVDSTAPDAATIIRSFTNGEGVAAAVVCTDSLAANEWALDLLRLGGTLVLLGLPPEKWRFDGTAIVFRELNLRGSYVASREAVERMMAVVETSRVRSHLTELPFEDIPRITDVYLSKSFSGRIVVRI